MKGKEPGENKGYAFVMFRTKELASKAMEKLNNTELKVTCNCFLSSLIPVLLSRSLHELLHACNTVLFISVHMQIGSVY